MANPSTLTSVRSSPAASQQILTSSAVVTPEGSLTPAGLQALFDLFTPIVQQFRNASSEQQVPTGQTTLTPGGTDEFRIASVGLGYELESSHSLTVSIQNTSAAAITVNASPFFPLDCITNTQVQLNGGATIYSASAKAGFKVATRHYRGILTALLAGSRNAFCNYSYTYTGTAPTVNAATPLAFSFSGIGSIDVPADSTITLNVKFETREPLAKDEVSLIGALMLQNNQTYATCQRQMIGNLLGTTNTSPLYTASANLANLTIGGPGANGKQPQIVTDTTYDFWALPTDTALYAEMVANSYYVTEQANNPINNTGSQAVRYNIPQNTILMAMHMGFVDGNGNYMMPYANAGESNAPDVPRWQLSYNAGVINPVTKFAGRERLRQMLIYGGDIGSVPGYLLWDGAATGPDVNTTDEAGFLDTYYAANPEFITDISSTVVTKGTQTATFSVTREYIVTSNVQVIGGAG